MNWARQWSTKQSWGNNFRIDLILVSTSSIALEFKLNKIENILIGSLIVSGSVTYELYKKNYVPQRNAYKPPETANFKLDLLSTPDFQINITSNGQLGFSEGSAIIISLEIYLQIS